jgi:hypothetical protein
MARSFWLAKHITLEQPAKTEWNLCVKNASEDANYDRKESSIGKPYLTLKAANHQVIGTSEIQHGIKRQRN